MPIINKFPGKTTLARLITNRVNQKFDSNHENIAAYIPMDGYHYSRAQLNSFPDPKSAHARRGAAFTFDAASILLLVNNLRKPLSPDTPKIYVPSFCHALKDPVENDIAISSHARILIFEGNYLALNMGPWREIAELFDERWLLQVDFKVAEKRLISRHIAAGIAACEEDARKRAQENDLVNGQQIVDNLYAIDQTITSIEI